MSNISHPQMSKQDIKIIKKRRIDHPDRRIRIRLNVLWFSLYYSSAVEIALHAGSSRRQVFSVLKMYKQGGLDAVMNIESNKRSSELEGFSELIRDEFEKTPPSSLKEARIKIREITGIERSESQIRKFLKNLGMKLLKPRLVPMGKSEDNLAEKTQKQREFATNELEPLLEEARKGERKVLFSDACHIQLACILSFLWCFAKRYIKALPLRGRVNIIGACSAYGEEMIYDITQDGVTSDVIAYFLVKVRNRIKKGKISLVLDNARYQKTVIVQETAKKLGIDLLYLPVASPNLNIIERLWKFAKKTFVSNRVFMSLDELEKHLKKCFSTLKNKHKKELRSILTLNFQYFDEKVQFQAA